MGRISHREFRTWQAWKKDQFNNPSRSDYYLMRIAGLIEHVMSKKGWKLSDYKIPFEFLDKAAKPLTVEDANRELARRRGEDI